MYCVCLRHTHKKTCMAKGEIEGLLDILDPEVSCNDYNHSILTNVDVAIASFGGFSLADGQPSRFDSHGRDRQHRQSSASGASCNSGIVGRYAQTSYHDKVVSSYMRRVRTVSEVGGLSVAIVRATEAILCKVIEAPSLRRSHKTGIIEGAVFIAACQCTSPRTTREVAHMFDVRDQVVVKGTQRVQSALACMSSHVSHEGSPDAFVPRFIALIMDCGLGYKCLAKDEHRCILHAKAISGALVDESPSTIATVAIASVFGCNSSKQINRIAQLAGVKANALKKCLKIIAATGVESATGLELPIRGS